MARVRAQPACQLEGKYSDSDAAPWPLNEAPARGPRTRSARHEISKCMSPLRKAMQSLSLSSSSEFRRCSAQINIFGGSVSLLCLFGLILSTGMVRTSGTSLPVIAHKATSWYSNKHQHMDEKNTSSVRISYLGKKYCIPVTRSNESSSEVRYVSA
jgi:hypothetical protein